MKFWTVLSLVGITFIVFFLHSVTLAHKGFSAEDPFFYAINKPLSGMDVLDEYRQFDAIWYRPTSFYGLRYLLRFLGLDEIHIFAFKFVNILTILMVCYAIYALSRLLYPDQRIAAFLAPLYFVLHPATFCPAYEVTAFDFLYILFSILCVNTFLYIFKTRSKSVKALVLCSSLILYVVALTCKELTWPIPALLLVACFIVKRPNNLTDKKPSIRISILYLLPFFLLFALYYLLHIRTMPTRDANEAYRNLLNTKYIFENITKYPMWITRIFKWTPDTAWQFEFLSPMDSWIGVGILLITTSYWLIYGLRNRIQRWGGVFLFCWLLVFSAIPIYSGLFGWHANLAIAGYAILVSVALEGYIYRVGNKFYISILLLLFVLSGVYVGRLNLYKTILEGPHWTSIRLNESILKAPPVAIGAMPEKAFIYIDDRHSLGRWNFGSGSLFKFIYHDLSLEEKQILRDKQDDFSVYSKWLLAKNAYFFQYDDQFVWHDATQEYRERSISNLVRYARDQLSENGDKAALKKTLTPFIEAGIENGDLNRIFEELSSS